MVWEINMGVCLRLEFNNIMHICCLGLIMVHLIFYVIPLSIYDVIYDNTTKSEGTLL